MMILMGLHCEECGRRLTRIEDREYEPEASRFLCGGCALEQATQEEEDLAEMLTGTLRLAASSQTFEHTHTLYLPEPKVRQESVRHVIPRASETPRPPSRFGTAKNQKPALTASR